VLSRVVYKKQRGRRLITALAAVSLVTGTFLVASTALAVHDAGLFELDTSSSASVCAPLSTPCGNANTADSALAGEDWATIYAGGGLATNSTLFPDPVGSAENSFYTGGGSKDVRDIPAWAYGTTNDVVPDKDDIADAFAASYIDPDDGHTIIYFGIDRYDNNGDAETGFWFFQDQVSLDGSGKFNGVHTIGDVLVLANWGGSNPVGQLTVYQWVGGKNPLALVADNIAADCATAAAGDNACAVVNRQNDDPPWAFSDKSGSADIRPLELFEAGLDINDLFGSERCFASFLASTRSSHSVTAQLKDFTLDTFEQCGASIATQVSDTALDIGDTVTDDATVTVSGGATPPVPTGDVVFTVDGAAFDTKPLSGAAKDGNDYTVTSAVYTATNAGEFCFSASWAGDTNYRDGPYVDDGANECFTVSPNEPNVTTKVNDEDPVTPGTEIYDTATLSGTAAPSNALDGTITFRAYGPEADATTCTEPAAYTSVVDVTGDGSYVSNTGTGGAFSPTAPGNYNWVAVYAPDAGDVNNLGDTTACGDANEGSVVEQFQPEETTAQTWSVFDTMTITVEGGGDLDGTARFTLHRTSDCTDDAIFTEDVPVSGPSGTEVSTTPGASTTFTGDEPILYWSVSYTSDNAAHADIAATCTENSNLDINN
jgi:hypothetical protein